MKLNKSIYIPVFSLILFVSLALLNNNSIQCSGSVKDKQYLKIRKSAFEKCSIQEVTDDNPRVTGHPLAKTMQFEETPVSKAMFLTALFLDKQLSDPTLFDLPPPPLHI
jgi:hypothetical protein